MEKMVSGPHAIFLKFTVTRGFETHHNLLIIMDWFADPTFLTAVYPLWHDEWLNIPQGQEWWKERKSYFCVGCPSITEKEITLVWIIIRVFQPSDLPRLRSPWIISSRSSRAAFECHWRCHTDSFDNQMISHDTIISFSSCDPFV